VTITGVIMSFDAKLVALKLIHFELAIVKPNYDLFRSNGVSVDKQRLSPTRPVCHRTFCYTEPAYRNRVTANAIYGGYEAAVCFWDHEGRIPKATLVVLLVVGISSLRAQK